MDFVGAVIGGRRLGERGRIDFGAVRHAPHPVAGLALRPQRLNGRNLAVERGIDLFGDDLRRTSAPVAGDVLRGRALGKRGRHSAVGSGRLAQLAHLIEREVERPAGREEVPRRLALLLHGLMLENGRELRQAREIGFRIRRRLDRVGQLKEIRIGEVGAVLLGDDIGALRVGDVEPLRTDIARLQVPDHDLAVEGRCRAQCCRVHALQAGDELLGPRDFLGTRLLIGTRVELRFERRKLTFIEACVGREIRDWCAPAPGRWPRTSCSGPRRPNPAACANSGVETKGSVSAAALPLARNWRRSIEHPSGKRSQRTLAVADAVASALVDECLPLADGRGSSAIWPAAPGCASPEYGPRATRPRSE